MQWREDNFPRKLIFRWFCYFFAHAALRRARPDIQKVTFRLLISLSFRLRVRIGLAIDVKEMMTGPLNAGAGVKP